MSKILIIFGTRPEIIKIAPVISEFKKRNLNSLITVLNTNQHKDLLKSYFEIFRITPDYNLNIMNSGQSLSELTAKTINELQFHLNKIKENTGLPEFIMAQGNTNTVFASAIIAFLNNIKFAHIEAGLRTFDFQNPYPEEYYRRVASLSTEIHFAPTEIAKENLIKEGINGEKILLTGNTIVDSLNCIKESNLVSENNHSEKYGSLIKKNNLVLITCHRRENHGKNLTNLINSVKNLSQKYSEFNFIWIKHPNPNVEKEIKSSNLESFKNIFLCEPFNYLEMISLYSNLKLIMTDSGGIQEEAPSFGVPVIVIGKKTERMEGILEGYSFLAGTEESEITSSFEKHLKEKIEITKNPYGDGFASKKIVDYFVNYFFAGNSTTV